MTLCVIMQLLMWQTRGNTDLKQNMMTNHYHHLTVSSARNRFQIDFFNLKDLRPYCVYTDFLRKLVQYKEPNIHNNSNFLLV